MRQSHRDEETKGVEEERNTAGVAPSLYSIAERPVLSLGGRGTVPAGKRVLVHF